MYNDWKLIESFMMGEGQNGNQRSAHFPERGGSRQHQQRGKGIEFRPVVLAAGDGAAVDGPRGGVVVRRLHAGAAAVDLIRVAGTFGSAVALLAADGTAHRKPARKLAG